LLCTCPSISREACPIDNWKPIGPTTLIIGREVVYDLEMILIDIEVKVKGHGQSDFKLKKVSFPLNCLTAFNVKLIIKCHIQSYTCYSSSMYC